MTIKRDKPFSLGEIVRLKSEGIELTVVDVDRTYVWVAWRDADGEAQEFKFPHVMVRRV